jgi:hypothetical protein
MSREVLTVATFVLAGVAACADAPEDRWLGAIENANPIAEAAPDAGPLADGSAPFDAPATPDAALDAATAEPDASAPPATQGGFIGAACDSVAACDYADAMCLAELPDGHCSQVCTRTCPDREGATRTFCVAASLVDPGGQEGRCVQRCDFGLSPTGCRAGYGCRPASRHSEPSVTASVCLPGEDAAALSPCVQELVALGLDFELASNPMDSPDGGTEVCDVRDPVRLTGRLAGVDFTYADFDDGVGKLFVTCEAALAIHATALIGRRLGIRAFTHLGTYNCRFIGGTSTLSQHAFANAIDLSGVETDDGARFSLIDDWERGVDAPVTPGGQLLKRLAETMHAERVWNIILTPEYNQAHWDHFHVDLTEGAHTLR